MRVGVFTNAYRPIISGVVNSIDLIRHELLRQGHVPFVWAPRFPGFREEHAGVFRYPSLSLTRQVQFPLPLAFRCRSLKPLALDILHTHHPFLLGDTARAYARELGIPLVFTFHTQYEQYCHYVPLPQEPLRRLTRWAVLRFARRCDLLVAPSPMIADWLRDQGLRVWTETVPNAIDLRRFTEASPDGVRERLGVPAGDRLALYAGRLGVEKNLEFLLEAFAAVAGPRDHLAIVGDGPVLERLKARAGQRVYFPGRVDYQDMPAWYAAADLFAMSSVTEVKPLVVLEALASGLPVVAVAACGTADTLTHGHDGLLSPCEQPAFQASLRQALTTDLTAMAANARRTALDYGIEGYVRRLVDLYREAVSRAGIRNLSR